MIFAPLYVSNMCANECTYCAFRATNLALTRRTLTQEEIAEETRILIRDGENILIADSAEALGAAVRRILREPSLARVLRENGRHWVEEKYDWRQVYAAWDTVYTRILNARNQT